MKHRPMSQLGHSRHLTAAGMSASLPIATGERTFQKRRYVPQAAHDSIRHIDEQNLFGLAGQEQLRQDRCDLLGSRPNNVSMPAGV